MTYYTLMPLLLWISTKWATWASEVPLLIVTDKHCITNSSSGLSYITSIESTSNKIDLSQFYPKQQNYMGIDCTIEKLEECTRNYWISNEWHLEDSINGPINQLITDWRWEGFPIYKTKNANIGNEEFFYEVYKNRNSVFKIRFSVRIEKEAHVFLCDGPTPSESTCYWILLDAWDGNKSAFRKCSPGSINAKYGIYPKPPCSNNLWEKTIEETGRLVYQDVWRHFQIISDGNAIKVMENDREILDYNDPSFFRPTRIFFHSKRVNGLWKLHKYTYIYTTIKSVTKLGPFIYLRKGQNCISMFIMTCAKCKLRFQIDSLDSGAIYDNEFTTKDEKWLEIKLLTNSGNSDNYRLFVITETEETSNIFWAIDNIRQCEPKEYRILTSPKEDLKCQVIEDEGSFDNQIKNVSRTDTNCPQSTIGTSCVPCDILLGGTYCKNFKYCEYLGYNEITCFCTSGYGGDRCDTSCQSHKYGHGCQRKCEFCNTDCNYTSGICLFAGCLNNYHGERCDIPPDSLLKYPPAIEGIGTTWCDVKISNFEIIGKKEPKYYKIQYKKAAGSHRWKEVNDNDYIFKKDQVIRVTNLKSNTEYYVRALLYSDKHYIFEGDNIEKKYFRTKCILPSTVNNLTNQSTSTSIYLKWETLGDRWCDIHYIVRYKFNRAKGCSQNSTSNYTEINVNQTEVVLSNLNPYSIYEINIAAAAINWTEGVNASFTVETKPSVPHAVRVAEVISKDEESISLRWKPPYPPTGVLSQYQIKYSKRRWYGSDMETQDVNVTQCRLWPDYHCATIRKNIEKDYEYYINIFARNEIPQEVGPASKFIETITRVEEPYPPTDIQGNWTQNNSLSISWRHPNVTNGPLTEFDIELNDKISGYLLKSEDNYMLTYSYQINEPQIKSCSKYTLKIAAKNRRYKNGDSISGTSPPPVPIVDSKFLKIDSTNITVIVRIPRTKLEKDFNYSAKVYMFISEFSNTHQDTLNELTSIENGLRENPRNPLETSHIRLVYNGIQERLPLIFLIGNDTGEYSEKNPPLEPGKKYTIYLFYVNECGGQVRLRIIRNATTTLPTTHTTENYLYALILLILVIPLLIYTYRNWRKNSNPIRPGLISSHTSKHKDVGMLPLTERQEENKDVNRHVVSSSPDYLEPILKPTLSKPIKVRELELYVKGAVQNGELETQHELFPIIEMMPWDYRALKANRCQTDYSVVYDHIRPGETVDINCLDCINGDYINGYGSPRAFIAARAPNPTTVNDFWRIVWQQNVENIIMLANIYENGKKKVEKYWPNNNEEKDFNGIRVQYVSAEVFADYEYRLFNVYYQGEQRKVEHLHFVSWPDHGVPLYSQSLVPFLHKVLKIPNRSYSPILVHCSDGIGRTGTLILSDICLRMAAREGYVDFLANLERLRSQRVNMVENSMQYKLAHLVVLESLIGAQTWMACDDDFVKNVESFVGTNSIRNQLTYLQDIEWQDKAMIVNKGAKEDATLYPMKDRFKEIVPGQNSRIILSRYPPKKLASAYINAVLVDGYRSFEKFIVTQQPMPNTLQDFWRLVDERNSRVIISLNKIDLSDKTSCHFWPENNEEIEPVDYLKIQHDHTVTLNNYKIVTVHLFNRKKNEERLLTIISLDNWKPGDLLPNSINEFLIFWEEADALCKQSKPVIVTCYDGATASGLYVAMSFVIEKIKFEHICDVCMAVRCIRRNRKQFVSIEEQFEFLYRASAEYINNGFSTYSYVNCP